MNTLTILKIGGKVLEDRQRLETLLSAFAGLDGHRILVHGGGRRADELIRQLGIEPRMVNGRRITDEPTLEIVTMVYAGLINKNIVAMLQAHGCNAIGLSGADANILLAHQRKAAEIDYGFAGDIDEVNTQTIGHLLRGRLTPVCCAITHDGKGQLLNTNADTIASRLAVALAPHYAVSLQFCFEKAGVLSDPDDEASVIHRLDAAAYRQYREAGTITAGMIPKLDNAFAAIGAGVKTILIGNPDSLAGGRATVIHS